MKEQGVLYVVSTPIGNLDDVTVRALEVFDLVDILVCEDTRITGRLLATYRKRGWIKSSPKLMSYNDHNAKDKYEAVVDLVENGSRVGLVSDAGTPTLSDPGYRVIRGCIDRGLVVQVIPGVSAITAALPYSGIGGEKFVFIGYLPKKAGKRADEIRNVVSMFAIYDDLRVVMYVTPHRVVKDLEAISEKLLDHRAVLIREVTKRFEERIEGSIGELLRVARERKLKGEMVLVISGER